MPREKTGHRQRGVMAPESMWDALDALAARNGRTAAAELLHALERHLAAPPTVTVETPPLTPAVIGGPVVPKAKRGRKPKGPS